MKPEQIDKLYKKLTPAEQASLAFEALVTVGPDEANTIHESVDPRAYHNYMLRFYHINLLAFYFGSIFWKTVAQLMSTCHSESSDVELILALDSQLASMDKAIADICIEMKIDILSMRKMAGCENTPDWIHHSSTPAAVERYTEEFMQLIK